MLFRNKDWQVHIWNNTNSMFFYSAYIDDRMNGHEPLNLIRIFTIFDQYEVSIFPNSMINWNSVET